MQKKKSYIPPEAKMVFKGVRYEVWQWEQKMYDGSTATFERITRRDSVNILAVVGDSLIVQKQEQPGWFGPLTTLPGGIVDEGEEPLAAAKRELLEETGFVSDDWVLWESATPSLTTMFTAYTFIARNCKKNEEPRSDAGEKIENRFASFEEFLELSEDPLFRELEVAFGLLRVRLDPAKKEEFRKLLFLR